MRKNRSCGNGFFMNENTACQMGISTGMNDGTGVKACVILDGASRMVLVGGEFLEINTENSKLVVDQLVDKYWWLCPMRELILDHGSAVVGTANSKIT